MSELPRERKGRTQIGESAGKRQRQNTFSMRASRGNLDVIQKRCSKCGHHKALKNNTNIRCSRCNEVHK